MSSAKAATRYVKRGYTVVPVPTKEKNPGRNGWEGLRITAEDVPRYFTNGQNIGIHCGEPSGWLVPADLDVAEARKIAGRFFPVTLTSGRDSTPDAHWWFVSEGAEHRTFKDLDGSMILELRSTGHHTLVEPSVHPSGEPYRWSRSGLQPEEISAEDLARACRELATAALIARHLPEVRDNKTGAGGGRHDLALALAGFILRRQLDEDTTLKLLRAAWDARGFAGDERARREAHRDLEGLVRDTAWKIQNGRPATGGPKLEEIVPGLRRKIADYWEWGGRLDDGVLPKIIVNNRYLREVTDDTLEAIRYANNPPEIFVRAGSTVRVVEDENGTPQIQNMDLNHVKECADQAADFVRVIERGGELVETKVNPPEVVVKNLMARHSLPFPPLEAVVESPILRPDGSIFSKPGYDPETRLYYRPLPGFECPEIPTAPTREQVHAALDLVNEAVGEFPYADKASAANTLSLVITSLIRQAIDGPTPLGLIDAPQAGTGKTLLAEIIAIIGTGRAGEMLGASRDDEEWRKAITAKLIGGSTLIIVDNVEGRLYAPSLARALTSRTWTDRVLGRSETATVRQRATWAATGNNITLGGDLARRCYWIRLDAKQSRPWQREDFKHPDLTAWAMRSRGELVAAVLTIARAWYATGKPKAEGVPRLGSFEAWTETIGGILAFAGVGGFLGNLEELYDKVDESTAEWEAFLAEWWRQRGEDPITGKALAKLITEEKSLRDALPGDLSEALDKGEGSFTRRLGKALAKRAGTRYGDDGLHITEAGKERAGKLWSLRDSSATCEFASFASLYNPSASKKVCNKFIQAGTQTEKSGSGGAATNSPNSQTRTTTSERPLTEDEAQQVQRRISEGMEAKLARASVLGEDVAF